MICDPGHFVGSPYYNSKPKGIAILVSKLKDDGQTQGIVLFYLWE